MSVAMRMPAVFHPHLDVEVGAEHRTPHRRSRWHRLGWVGFDALGFLLLLVIVAMIGPAHIAIVAGRSEPCCTLDPRLRSRYTAAADPARASITSASTANAA